jgi:hypothetical protein
MTFSGSFHKSVKTKELSQADLGDNLVSKQTEEVMRTQIDMSRNS